MFRQGKSGPVHNAYLRHHTQHRNHGGAHIGGGFSFGEGGRSYSSATGTFSNNNPCYNNYARGYGRIPSGSSRHYTIYAGRPGYPTPTINNNIHVGSADPCHNMSDNSSALGAIAAGAIAAGVSGLAAVALSYDDKNDNTSPGNTNSSTYSAKDKIKITVFAVVGVASLVAGISMIGYAAKLGYYYTASQLAFFQGIGALCLVISLICVTGCVCVAASCCSSPNNELEPSRKSRPDQQVYHSSNIEPSAPPPENDCMPRPYDQHIPSPYVSATSSSGLPLPPSYESASFMH